MWKGKITVLCTANYFPLSHCFFYIPLRDITATSLISFIFSFRSINTPILGHVYKARGLYTTSVSVCIPCASKDLVLLSCLKGIKTKLIFVYQKKKKSSYLYETKYIIVQRNQSIQKKIEENKCACMNNNNIR